MGLIDNIQQLREDEYEGLLKSPEVDEDAVEERAQERSARRERDRICAGR